MLSLEEQSSAVRAIAQQHGIAWRDAAPFATGSDVVWRVAEVVVKLTLPRWRDAIETEFAWLEALEGRLPLATPRPIACGQAPWPYLVMGRQEGISVSTAWPTLNHGQRLRVARDLGAAARSLHRLPTSVAPGGRTARDWPPFWSDCRESARTRHEDVMARAPLAGDLDPWIDGADVDGTDLVPLHTELHGDHVLLELHSDGPRLTGVIDWADARVGLAAYEFPSSAEFLFRGERGMLGAYLAGYGISAEGDRRGDPRHLLALSLCHRFADLERLIGAAPRKPRSLEELAALLFAR